VENAARIQIDQADQRQFLPEERLWAAKKYISSFLVGTWHLLRGSSKQVLGPLLNGTWFGYLSSGPGFRDEAFELVPGQKLVAPTRSSKQVFDETWFGDLSSGPGFGDKATFDQVLLKLAPPRGPQSKYWDLILMRHGLGIYLQDLDFGDEAFEQILYQSWHLL
jgi:hypothetical protein